MKCEGGLDLHFWRYFFLVTVGVLFEVKIINISCLGRKQEYHFDALRAHYTSFFYIVFIVNNSAKVHLCKTSCPSAHMGHK